MYDFNIRSPILVPAGSDEADGLYYRYPMKTLTIGNITINNPIVDLRPRLNQSDGRQSGVMFGYCWGVSGLMLNLHELRKLHTFISVK